VLWSSAKLSWHQLHLLALFSGKNDVFTSDFCLFCWVFHQFVDKHAVHVQRKNVSLNLFLKVRDKVQNVFVKSSQSRSLAVSSVKDLCKTEKSNSIEQKTGVEQPQTARSEQTYKCVTELICSHEGNTGSSRSPRKTRNLKAISLSFDCCEKLSWTQTRHR